MTVDDNLKKLYSTSLSFAAGVWL